MKNRALMETQRVYELDRKELKSELQTKEVELKYNVRSKKRIEEESKRKMEDHQRKLLAETERKLMDTKSRAQRDLMTKEEKLAILQNFF